MLTWEKIPGCPRFTVLEAMESWAGPGNEANQVLQVTCAASGLYDKIIITIVPSYILEKYHSFVAIANITHAAHL